MSAGRRILLVSGLSGAGKSSILRVLEDLGLEAVDNPPMAMIRDIIDRGRRPMAIGVDARSSGFDGAALLGMISDLRANPTVHAELLFAVADEAILLRRYTATRRRHPLAASGSVLDGIAAETALTQCLREAADLVVDTTDLRPPELRLLIEGRYADTGEKTATGLTVCLISFAFPAGLPRESDMVFDARFLRNPFYDPILASLTGLDRRVTEHVESDPDYRAFLDSIHDLLRLVLPRFVTEGKKYATVAVGCSGGRHRSVALVETLARRLGNRPLAGEIEHECFCPNEPLDAVRPPIIVMHRELSRAGWSS